MKYFKDYLTAADKEKILFKLWEIERNRQWNKPDDSENERQNCFDAYSIVYDRLLSFGEWTWFRKKYKLTFRYIQEFGGDEMFIDSSLLNVNYEEPPEGLEPWGGKHDDKEDAPDGYYNINCDEYNKWFSVSMIPWRILVNLEVVFEPEIEEAMAYNGITIDDCLAAAIYDFTFEGFTERSYLKLKNQIKETMTRIDSGEEELIDMDVAMQQVKDYVEDRSPTQKMNKEGGPTIKISESALESLKKISAEEQEKS